MTIQLLCPYDGVSSFLNIILMTPFHHNFVEFMYGADCESIGYVVEKGYKPPSPESVSTRRYSITSTALQNAPFVPMIFEPLQHRDVYDISSTADGYDNALNCFQPRSLSYPQV
jgi:hypothetical protein